MSLVSVAIMTEAGRTAVHCNRGNKIPYHRKRKYLNNHVLKALYSRPCRLYFLGKNCILRPVSCNIYETLNILLQARITQLAVKAASVLESLRESLSEDDARLQENKLIRVEGAE